MQDTLEIILRTSIALMTLLVMTRIMGRKSVAQLSFFDYVSGITIGSIGAVLAVDRSIGIVSGLVSLGVVTAWMLIINAVTGSSVTARKLIDSVPMVVIYRGQILEGNLRDRHYSVNDLLEQLREQEVFDPNEIEVAIAETDGQLSILKKTQFQAAMVKDLTMANGSKGFLAGNLIGKELIIDGRVIHENLLASGFTVEWLFNQVQAQGVSKIEDVTVAMLTPQGDLYIDQKDDMAPGNLKT